MPKIDQFFLKMMEAGASDLHMSSHKRPMIRESGEMRALIEQKLSPDTLKQLLLEIMPERNQKELEEIWDTDFAYEVPDKARFRANVFFDRFGIGAVFREIPSKILTAEDLNLPQAIIDLCYLSKGFVVVTGPTGSGKSTTLAAMIDFINKNRNDHIITIEDPIEFVHQDIQCLINQREMHRHTKSFKNSLRAALRQDPDIVLVGEMRDLETIEIAIETAETGHLVFGTLHTNTAASTVDRIIDQFPEGRQTQIRTMLSSSLKGVIAQTLCRKNGGGRVAALEILIANTGIANMIRDGKTYQIPSSMQTGMKSGMVLLNDSLLKLVKEGKVDPREAYIKAVDKNDMLNKFRQNNIEFDVSKLANTRKPATAPSQQQQQPPPARKSASPSPASSHLTSVRPKQVLNRKGAGGFPKKSSDRDSDKKSVFPFRKG